MKIIQGNTLAGILIIISVGIAACDKPGPAETAGKSIDQAAEKAGDRIDETSKGFAEKRDDAGVVMDDAAITTKVKGAILAEPGLRSLQISVTTVNGVATLSGSVDSQQSSNRAKEIAAAVAGVRSVENNLVVK